MAKIRESIRKAQQRKFGLGDNKKHYRSSSLSLSEKEALREISAKDFKMPSRYSRYF